MKEISNFKSKKVSISQAQKVNDFLLAAYSDYIAARILLLNDQLVQGCHLSNTAIEKYYKAYKAILSEPIPRHHDITVRKFQNTIKNKFPSIYNSINFEFLKFLSKTYSLRYLDDIPYDFNLVIIKNKVLAELDQVVNILESSIKIDINRSGQTERKYAVDKIENNRYLLKDNYLLLKIKRKSFVENINLVYEIRKIPNLGICEINYYTNKIVDDGKFDFEGLQPKTSYPSTEFQLFFSPLNNED